MRPIATTKLSSNGRVVIPEEIRRRLGLRTGDQFVVVGSRDALVLKAITAPSMDDLGEILAEARKAARKAGMKRVDVRSAVARVRARR